VQSGDNAPLVSILTPSLNQGRFLGECIVSIERQTYRPVEHIICDGGSSDGTPDILARAPEHVRWVREPDSGQGAALNRAYQLSKGDIIGWVNSDDGLFAVDALEVVVRRFDRGDADAIVGDTAIVRDDGLVARHFHSYLPRRRRLPRWSSPVSQPALFLHRTALAPDEPLVRESLQAALDLELVLRLLERGTRIASIPHVLALDRDHPDRKMRRLQSVFAEEAAALRREYGYRLDPQWLERALAWQRRLRGLPTVWSWSRYEPAARWRTDARLLRVARQLLAPHSRAAGL
jgi:glycosyltransferase involved in cell wall biosynthesis